MTAANPELDPRTSVIGRRLADIERVIAVAGGKGGVGKSSVASMLSLALSSEGKKVGLLDMDFHGPTDHLILGLSGEMPAEDKGIVPPEISGIRFMTISYYSSGKPSPIRGDGLTESIIELLAITKWGKLDYLIIDLPPGLGEATLDIMRFVPDAEFLAVYNDSRLVKETVRNLIILLKESGIPVIGAVENMGSKGDPPEGASFLGSVRYDDSFEKALGSREMLAKTNFFADVKKILPRINRKFGGGQDEEG